MSQAPTQNNAAPGNPDVVSVDFSIPANFPVNGKVIGTIRRTGVTQLELTRNNRLQWAPLVITLANMGSFNLNIKRGGREIRHFPQQLLNTGRAGPYFPGFPQNIGAGQIQFEVEKTGSTAGTNSAGTITIDMVFAASTQIVTS